MADKCSGRAIKLLQFAGFEGQDAQDVIDIWLHGRRPARPPCPHAGADIVDDRNGGVQRAHLAGDPQRKVGAVDGDQTVRFCLGDRTRGLADALQEARQIAHNGAQAHQRDFAGVEQRDQAQGLEMTSARADQLHIAPAGRLERAHEVGAEQIAQFLTGDDGYLERAGRGHGAGLPFRPMTNSPSASALSTIAAYSRTRVFCASTPIPARPAAWAASTVAGPIVGRSSRNS